MIKTHLVNQGSDEWLELRAGKYTGSNAHKLLRFGAIDYSLTEQSSFGGNFYTKRGHLLEDQAITVYQKITGATVERPGFVTNSLFSDCGYSPDGIDASNNVLLEVKCFNADRHLKIAGGDVPLEILAQIHFGMLIAGFKSARLLLFNPELARGDNPQPKLAFYMMDIKHNPVIARNFKNILKKDRIQHA